jgi:hypothetical protein
MDQFPGSTSDGQPQLGQYSLPINIGNQPYLAVLEFTASHIHLILQRGHRIARHENPTLANAIAIPPTDSPRFIVLPLVAAVTWESKHRPPTNSPHMPAKSFHLWRLKVIAALPISWFVANRILRCLSPQKSNEGANKESP